MRALLALAFVALFAGCAQQAAVAEDASPGQLPESEESQLVVARAVATPRQRCYVQVFEERDLNGRACMVPCILGGRGAMIGGGCWHICYAYTDQQLPNSSEFNSCPAPEPRPPSPPPSVVCTTDPADRALRIVVVDAHSERPIPTARIAIGSLEERLITDGVGQAQVVDPPTGPLEIHVFATQHFSHSASLIVPEQSRCEVSFELVTTRGHGF